MATVHRLTGAFGSTNGAKSVTDTPTAGRLPVIVTAHTGNTAVVAPTDDNPDGLGTYTLAHSAVKNGSTDAHQIWIRDALIGSEVSTIFTHNPGTTTGGGLRVYEVAGMTRVGASAKRQAAGQDNASAGTPAVVLAQAVLTANPCIGSVFNATNPSAVGAPSGWTQDPDAGYNVPTTGYRSFRRDSGETGTTITFAASATDFSSFVLELDASAGLEAPYSTVTIR